MKSLDLRVLADALQWRRAGHAVTLLAVRDDGRVSGSVSGGCVEDDLCASNAQPS